MKSISKANITALSLQFVPTEVDLISEHLSGINVEEELLNTDQLPDKNELGPSDKKYASLYIAKEYMNYKQ